MPERELLREVEMRRSAALRAHECRVGRIAAQIAANLGQEPSACEALGVAAEFHDIGKLAVSGSILDKQGKLDPDEWSIVQTHTTHGYGILRAAGNPLADLGATVALNHHECWDGTGYPHQRKGAEIPLAARIVSLSDYYDALREVRAYKAPREHEEVLHMILNGEQSRTVGKFDPALLTIIAADPDQLRRAYDG